MPSEQRPPRLPVKDADLRDAQSVCAKVYRRGTLALNQYERERLTRHCGRMPESKTQAQRWRIYLRALAKELAAEHEPQ